MSKTKQLRIASSILQDDKGYFPVIHHVLDDGSVGEVITTSGDVRFASVDEAKEIGSAILSEGIKQLKAEGLDAFRPKDGT